MGLGVALIPLISEWILGLRNWQAVYATLGMGVLGAVLPSAAVSIRDNAHSNRADTNDQLGSDTAGVPLGRALRDRRYWAFLAAFFLLSASVSRVAIHLASMLSDAAVRHSQILSAVSSFGFAMIAGRVATGAIMDRVFAPFVGAACLLQLVSLPLPLDWACTGPSSWSALR